VIGLAFIMRVYTSPVTPPRDGSTPDRDRSAGSRPGGGAGRCFL